MVDTKKREGRKGTIKEYKTELGNQLMANSHRGSSREGRDVMKMFVRLKMEIRHESRINSLTCDVYLCYNNERNCFRE